MWGAVEKSAALYFWDSSGVMTDETQETQGGLH